MAQKRDWEHSGASCFTPFTTCLLSNCCPCITYGRTYHRLTKGKELEGYSCCNLPCVGFCLLTGFGLSWIMSMLQRGEVRAGYQLKGNACTDCLCSCCCMPCDLTQQDKEVQFREREKAEKAHLIVNEQPNKEANMGYQPQPQYQPQQAYQPHGQQQPS
ncbi:uncharacterized protein BDZ99DRAFT_504829 [Mytilinidion resinicola]|uniref:PLAC8-domain-containing protein n=1 Tax=Mytilinidion resinicola TaxID=574789 RepID=A0A6A6Z834_9PEZI|nr:uncharacterized protein BDZ99DRAFT_504829 [Mytilinidion resinicola]KAF2816883.1 hypothetical protein BDZ99DRAFT_504829 [Mytilinidion resinicola]